MIMLLAGRPNEMSHIRHVLKFDLWGYQDSWNIMRSPLHTAWKCRTVQRGFVLEYVMHIHGDLCYIVADVLYSSRRTIMQRCWTVCWIKCAYEQSCHSNYICNQNICWWKQSKRKQEWTATNAGKHTCVKNIADMNTNGRTPCHSFGATSVMRYINQKRSPNSKFAQHW